VSDDRTEWPAALSRVKVQSQEAVRPSVIDAVDRERLLRVRRVDYRDERAKERMT
jgi:hypothetical protein